MDAEDVAVARHKIQIVPAFGSVASHTYPEAPGFEGGVELIRHAQPRIIRDGISVPLFERALLHPIRPDIPDGFGSVWRERDGLRIVIIPHPELYRGRALVKTVYRVGTRANARMRGRLVTVP